jgi:predicted Zn-dependent peptidase
VDGAEQSIADLVLYDRPLTELREYATNVRNVTPEQLQAALAASLEPSKMSLIVVGDAQTFGAELMKDHAELEQIAIDQLSLDSVTLRTTNTRQPR